MQTNTVLPAISIVMPSHNRCDRLARALGHIRAQTYPHELVEMVIVLDGCTDGSAAMVERVRADFPFALHIIEQKQGGPAAARNVGVFAAQNEFIVFLDDDVMVTPDLLMEYANEHQRNSNVVIIGTMSTPHDHHRPLWVRWEEYILENQYRDILEEKYALTARQFYTGNCFLKRSWIIDAGMFDETYTRYEDVELAYRIARLGIHFAFNPRAIGYHYANRTYASWTRAHYLYGQYAIKMGRDKGYPEVFEYTREEFALRHPMTRFLAESLLNHPLKQRVVIFLLMAAAQCASLLKQERRSFQALSSIANILFWQGYNDEMTKQPTVSHSAVLQPLPSDVGGVSRPR